MKTTKKDYQEIAKTASKKSPIVKNTILAFIIGGLICIIGQAIMDLLKLKQLSKDQLSMSLPIIMVFLGAFFTGLGIYDKLAKYGGAGTLVPITGFANAIVSPAMEFKSEGYVLGMSAKMFIIAGPVLVYGISTSIIYGIIYYFIK